MGHFHSFIYEYPVGIPAVILGFVILVLGRKLFWLFVGAVGVVTGMHIAAYSLHGQPEWVILLVGLLAGITGAVLAVFLQRMAVVVGGFFAGGYITLYFVSMWGWHTGMGYWFVSVVGGTIGAIMAAAYFDWALIILSSLTGAAMISQSVNLSPVINVVIFALMIFIGIFAQSSMMKKNLSQASQQ